MSKIISPKSRIIDDKFYQKIYKDEIDKMVFARLTLPEMLSYNFIKSLGLIEMHIMTCIFYYFMFMPWKKP